MLMHHEMFWGVGVGVRGGGMGEKRVPIQIIVGVQGLGEMQQGASCTLNSCPLSSLNLRPPYFHHLPSLSSFPTPGQKPGTHNTQLSPSLPSSSAACKCEIPLSLPQIPVLTALSSKLLSKASHSLLHVGHAEVHNGELDKRHALLLVVSLNLGEQPAGETGLFQA